ncbi:MAG TPA: type II toxin-antitoxin system VapC family toxin [archaeon]|nr:type II toxin-antitoxin system VapC family toxin [archaeon]
MIYLDANVFIYHLLDSSSKGENARKIFQNILKGDESAVTSSLTIDEVVWILWKNVGREKATTETLKIFEMPNLEILSLTSEMSFKSLLLMQKYKKLKPRDAAHAAVCLSSGVFQIVSDDSDFDEIKELTRVKL